MCVYVCVRVCCDNRDACSCCKGEVGHHGAWMMRSHLNQVNHCLFAQGGKVGDCHYLYSNVRVRRRLFFYKQKKEGRTNNLLINYRPGSVQTHTHRNEMCLELIYVCCLPLTHQNESHGEMSLSCGKKKKLTVSKSLCYNK